MDTKKCWRECKEFGIKFLKTFEMKNCAAILVNSFAFPQNTVNRVTIWQSNSLLDIHAK